MSTQAPKSRDAVDGTRVFLFSDIEGSTRLEQAMGTAAYATLRERHRTLLRAAFVAHNGLEQGTEGDSFFVVFATAAQAIAAALDGQRSLWAEPWPEGGTVRVRMGLNAGEATSIGGSLVGTTPDEPQKTNQPVGVDGALIRCFLIL